MKKVIKKKFYCGFMPISIHFYVKTLTGHNWPMTFIVCNALVITRMAWWQWQLMYLITFVVTHWWHLWTKKILKKLIKKHQNTGMLSMLLKVLESRRSKMSYIYEIMKEMYPFDFHQNSFATAHAPVHFIYGYLWLDIVGANERKINYEV